MAVRVFARASFVTLLLSILCAKNLRRISRAYFRVRLIVLQASKEDQS
jgi:hypothetical protein